MAERPILFSGPMVRAILEDRKAQTRRRIKRQRDMEFDINDPHFGPYWLSYATDADGEAARVRCPYGSPGDRLWVREGHALDGSQVFYRAGHAEAESSGPRVDVRWRPSIHMPRWASRITLEITGVRVERLQQISGPDCWEEGISHAGWDPERYGSVVECYRDLWDSINARNRPKLPSNPNSSTSWDANPWVWVVEFRRLTPSSHCALEQGDA